jgi:Two component regulator propeller
VKITIFFSLLIYLSSTAGAQLPFTRLTSEDGLGNNSVQCILQGRDGIMWIGTNGGLNRYDGAAFIQYSILSKPALSSNVITALLKDDAGNIWVGTENGLNILDPVANTIRPFSHPDLSSAAFSPGPVKALQKMKDGSIWILSATQITAYTLQNGFRRVRLDSALLGPTRVFTGLTQNGARRLWISYLDQPAAQVVRYTSADGTDSIGSTGLSWPGCSLAYSDSLHQDSGISYFGIIRYDEATGRFKTWLTNKSAHQIPDLHLYTCYCADAEGNIWEGPTGRMRCPAILKTKTLYWVRPKTRSFPTYPGRFPADGEPRRRSYVCHRDDPLLWPFFYR